MDAGGGGEGVLEEEGVCARSPGGEGWFKAARRGGVGGLEERRGRHWRGGGRGGAALRWWASCGGGGHATKRLRHCRLVDPCGRS